MKRSQPWSRSGLVPWMAALVSLLMLALYVQQLVGADPRPSTPYVTAAWAAIFAVSLGVALYRARQRNR